MKLSLWIYNFFLVFLISWLPINKVYALPMFLVSCEAQLQTNPIIISNAVKPANTSLESTNAILEYSCTNSSLFEGYVSLCFAVDGGDYKNSALSPRYMKNESNSLLAFNMTLPDGSIWGSRTHSFSEYNTGPIYIAGRPLLSAYAKISGLIPIKVSLVSDPTNFLAPPGQYINNFGNGNHTSLTFDANTNQNLSNCLTKNQGSGRFEFEVRATVIPSCEITSISDINLGTYSAGNHNISGTNNIDIRCTNSVPYYIGLAPSNKNNLGSGIMHGTSSTDKIPYQLRSTNGLEGKIWGNTATSTNVGNGVSGIGTGSTNTHPVYVTVPQTDVRPDNYSDTVDIRINY